MTQPNKHRSLHTENRHRFRWAQAPRLLALTSCLIISLGCGKPEIPDFGDVERFQEDPIVGRLISQRLDQLQQDPQNLKAWMALGMAFEANEFLPEALSTYRASTQVGEDPRLLYRLANTQMTSGQIDDAIGLFAQAAEAAPDYGPIFWRLGLAYLRLGDLSTADQHLRHALELSPRLLGAEIGLARVALQQNNAEAAVARLAPVVRKHPKLAKGHHLLGIAYRRLGRDDEARIHLEAGVPAAPTESPGSDPTVMPGVDPWQEDLAKSRVSYRMLVDVAGKAFAAGNFEKAKSTLESLRQHRPDDITLILNLATIYRRTGQEQTAAVLLTKALDKHPNRVQLALDLGETLLASGKLQQALSATQKAQTIAPDAPEPLALLARIHTTQGNFESAIVPLEQALERAPSTPGLHLELGTVLTALSRVDEAAEHFEKALELGADPRTISAAKSQGGR